MSSRGLRNNNPGNIRRSATRYRGEVVSQDPSFKRFESMAWGYRAMFVLLYTYQKRYGLSTLAQLIARYAPAVENDTAGYTDFVAEQTAWPADQPLDTCSAEQMIPVVSAMSHMENGLKALPEEVAEGWRLFEQFKP